MIAKKFDVLSSCALATMVMLFVVAISGCDRREEVYPVEGNAYMHDPEFKAQLDEHVKIRDDLRDMNAEVLARLEAMIKEMGSFEAVTNTPKGAELYAEAMHLDSLFRSNRLEVARITRERIKRATEDSKRILRGEAKAKKISKKETK